MSIFLYCLLAFWLKVGVIAAATATTECTTRVDYTKTALKYFLKGPAGLYEVLS